MQLYNMIVASIPYLVNSLVEGEYEMIRSIATQMCQLCTATRFMIRFPLWFLLEKCTIYVEHHLVDFVLGYVLKK